MIGDVVDKTLKRIRGQVILVIILAFNAGIAFAFMIAEYRVSGRDLDGGRILVFAVFLVGTILNSWIIWASLEKLNHPTKRRQIP